MPFDYYRPPIKERLKAHFDMTSVGTYRYRSNLEILRYKNQLGKITGLIDLIYVYHPNTAIHAFEVGYLVALLDQPSIYSGFVHDIGKTGIDKALLDKPGELTEEERRKMSYHGPLGGAILRKVGLKDLAYASEEHHIGNSKRRQWTEREIKSRHPSTEVLTLADLICASLDPRRSYHTPEKLEDLLKDIDNKAQRGIFSLELYNRFKEVILSKNLFPPFRLNQYTDEFFISVLKQLNIYGNFQDLIIEDEISRFGIVGR